MMQQHSNLDTSGGEELPQISCRAVWSIFIQNNLNKHHIDRPQGLGMECLHWYGNILMKFLLLAAPEVFIFTTSSAASDENWSQNIVCMTVFFQLKIWFLLHCCSYGVHYIYIYIYIYIYFKLIMPQWKGTVLACSLALRLFSLSN